jgi:hypothetical protein
MLEACTVAAPVEKTPPDRQSTGRHRQHQLQLQFSEISEDPRNLGVAFAMECECAVDVETLTVSSLHQCNGV